MILLPKDGNHWSIRATNNPKELKDFICSADYATFGLFNVNVPSQEKDFKSAYTLYLLLLPIL